MSAAVFSLGLGSHKTSTDVCLGVEASSQGTQCKQLLQHIARAGCSAELTESFSGYFHYSEGDFSHELKYTTELVYVT